MREDAPYYMSVGSPLFPRGFIADPERRTTVNRYVIERRDQLTIGTKHRLEQSIQTRITVRGYRNSNRAPHDLLIPALVEDWDCAPSLIRAILLAWMELHLGLQIALKLQLVERDIPIIDLAKGVPVVVGCWDNNELNGIFTSVGRERIDVHYDDYLLMLICLTGRVPIDESCYAEAACFRRDNMLDLKGAEQSTSIPADISQETHQIQECHNVKWPKWLEEISALSPQSPEWDEPAVDAFVVAVQTLAKARRAEREIIRDHLRQALTGLLDETASELDYFGYQESANWLADTIELGKTGAVAQQIDQFCAHLKAYRALQGQPKPGTFTQEQQRRSQLDEMATQIIADYAELSAVFLSAPPLDTHIVGDKTLPDCNTPGTHVPPESSLSIFSEELSSAADNPSIVADISQEVPQATAVNEGSLTDITPLSDSQDDSAKIEQSLTVLTNAVTDEATHHITTKPEQAEATDTSVAESTFDKQQLDIQRAQVLVLEEASLPPVGIEAIAHNVLVNEPTIVQSEAEADAPEESRTAQSCAQQILNGEGSWTALQVALLTEDDLPGAYWLARSMAGATEGLIADPLLAAAQGARWLSSASASYIDDLRDIALNYQPNDDDVSRLMGLAAAVRPVVLAPTTGMVGWLNVPACCPQLYGLVSALKEFADTGVVLHSEDLLGFTGTEQRQASLVDSAASARQWLAEAPHRRNAGASSIWRELVGPRGGLSAMMISVADDNRTAVQQVRQQIDNWSRRDYVLEQVKHVGQRFTHNKWRPITSDARDQILRDADEACAIARRWCDLIDHHEEIERRGDWIFGQVSRLRDRIRDAAPVVEQGLTVTISANEPTIRVASLCLLRAVRQLCETLNLPVAPSTVNLPVAGMPLGRLADGRSLTGSLNRYLLWLPNIPLLDSGEPAPETFRTICDAICQAYAQERPLQIAFDDWIHRQDYRYVDVVIDMLSPTTDTADRLRQYQEALADSRATLQTNIVQTESAVEQALLDGTITEEERTTYSNYVSAVNLDTVQLFQLPHERLKQIRDDLTLARQQRQSQLNAIWENLRPRLSGSSISPETQTQIESFIATMLRSENTRVTEECLSRLTQALDTGGHLEDSWFASGPIRDVLREFMQALPRIEEWLKQAPPQAVQSDIRNGRTRADIAFGQVPEPRRKEAIEAINAWHMLRQGEPTRRDVPMLLTQVLTYCGFTFSPDVRSCIRVESHGGDWIYVRATMSASDLARPIPQFGSQTRGQYEIVCLWERPGADTIAARLQELRLSLQNVLVLYLGRLNARQRRNVAQVSQERELAIAFLDEAQLIFLAQERDARLPVFLRCTLPFAALNPYTPFQAGNVPLEMFFGRVDEARELQRPNGSCLVYGGRQLGKSALLRHVQREFHHPDRGQYAWVEDIKRLGDPLASDSTTDVIWRKLRDGLKSAGFLSQKITTEQPDELERHIREAMNGRPERRVLMLFDEADNFLESDARDNFAIVDRLRSLMAATERRFKIVFAGLHNVQRFQGIPNQPLAHFGAPLPIGPLEPDAALRLVREPLEALGYRFADNATALLILSYTNYHPGLIQIFCQDLLKRLQSRRGASLPPYTIERRDVEGIYRDPQVRDRIRERFDWTLALDLRYQAIAWTLISEQLQVRDSYAQSYTRREIFEMVRSIWPRGFSEVDDDRLRSLLDEMCGLGVLVRTSEGKYRLRSPNLVRLMGTEDSIIVRLLELTEKQPPAAFEADYHHAPLSEEGSSIRYSPLTYAQERSLNPQKSGLGLVHASEALGLRLMVETFQHFIPRDARATIGKLIELPQEPWSGASLKVWLEREFSQYPDYERIIVYHRVAPAAPEKIAHVIREADAFCARVSGRKRSRWVRLLFLFDPEATEAWLALPRPERDELENRANAVEYPRRWNEIGIRQRLELHDALGTEEVCREIYQATGGWPFLLDALFKSKWPQDDARIAARELTKELQTSGSPLHQDFRSALGLNNSETHISVLSCIAAEEHGAPADDIGMALIADASGVPLDRCESAVEFMRRMGCIDTRDGLLVVEPIVREIVKLV